MVHFIKAAIVIASIAILPSLAVPIQPGQAEADLMAREPWRFSFKKAFRSIGHVLKKAAPIAKFLPGPAGAIASVASSIIRRDIDDVDEVLYSRALEDELQTRGYDVEIDVRDVEGLEARDISDALSARDNIYSIVAREIVDSMETQARRELSDELQARGLDVYFDELD